jgi:hypothetical protein
MFRYLNFKYATYTSFKGWVSNNSKLIKDYHTKFFYPLKICYLSFIIIF